MRKSVVIGMIAVLCLTGCGSTKIGGSSSNSEYKPATFEVDDSTIRNEVYDYIEENNKIEEAEKEQEAIQEAIQQTVVDPNITVGELAISNQDTSEDFEISGDDIIYNGITYKGLNEALNHMEYPTDRTTFINFILKTFNQTTNNVVYCNCVNDVEEDLKEDSTNLDIDVQLDESEVYRQIKAAHNNEPAIWTLSIWSDITAGSIYGCSEYLIYNGTDSLYEVDMSQF
jgi:hypothetical protein